MFCTACEKQQFEDIKKNLAHVTDIFVQPRYTLHNKDLAVSKIMLLEYTVFYVHKY